MDYLPIAIAIVVIFVVSRLLIGKSSGKTVKKAKKDGKYTGRKENSTETIDKYLSKPKTKKMIELLNQGNSVRSIVRVLECSPNSVYKLKKILNEN